MSIDQVKQKFDADKKDIDEIKKSIQESKDALKKSKRELVEYAKGRDIFKEFQNISSGLSEKGSWTYYVTQFAAETSDFKKSYSENLAKIREPAPQSSKQIAVSQTGVSQQSSVLRQQPVVTPTTSSNANK